MLAFLSIGDRYAARVVGVAAKLSIGDRYAAWDVAAALTIDRTPLRGYRYAYTCRHNARIDHAKTVPLTPSGATHSLR